MMILELYFRLYLPLWIVAFLVITVSLILDFSGNSQMLYIFSWRSIAFYCSFCIFVFSQPMHIRMFPRASETYVKTLKISSSLGALTGFAYLVYYGWEVAWWASILVFIVGAMVARLWFRIDLRSIGFGLGGFIGWPVSAYFMFKYVTGTALH